MAKKNEISADTLIADIRNKQFAPVYLLHGEESYYIDLITEALQENVLSPAEKDFNEIVLYGSETDVARIASECRFYTSFSDYRLVIVKEAQQVSGLDKLESYFKQPMQSTILVLNYKHSSPDKRKKWILHAEKIGIVYESKKIYDNQVPQWISNYLHPLGFAIDTKTGSMLADFLGTDLSKIVGEISKLIITLPEGSKRITSEHVEKNIGISKDYNNFEYLKALISGDILKANRIVNYFDANPKQNPMVVTLSILFNYFSNLMICCYATNKSESGLMKELNVFKPNIVRDYHTGLKRFSPKKIFDIIVLLRDFDAKAKGIGSSPSVTSGELLKELTFRILH